MTPVRSKITLCLVLATITLAVYWPATRCDFVDYDDTDYVTENRVVRTGLTWHSVAWAFETTHAANWHPLTWLSHMLDVQLFGLNPWGHHLTNILLHTASALLLFLLLARMTQTLWPSGIVAALFAWHPLHVESVAWVAERKDVLSTLFGLLAIWAYVRWLGTSEVPWPKSDWTSPKSGTRSPQSKAHGVKSRLAVSRPAFRGSRFAARALSPIAHLPSSCLYLLSLALFALSLMSKPMLVTLPCLLLLLDYWPLNRLRPTAGKSKLRTLLPLVWEKVPFLALSLASALITLAVQGQAGVVRSLQSLPLPDRIANALVAYVLYLVKALWPARLAFFYPHPISWPWWQVLGAATLLTLVSAGAILARRLPFLLVGWLWFLGMLVPVIGLVQVGFQALADRYSYLPLVGIFIMVVWGIAQLAQRWPTAHIVFAALAAALPLACAAVSLRQVTYWQNSQVLCEHALRVTSNNWLAHDNLGAALEHQNKFDEALAHFETAFRLEAALKINPDLPTIRYDLGTALGRKGKLDEAKEHLVRALQMQPEMAKAHHNLACVLTLQGQFDKAISHYREALRLDPHYDEARVNLQAVLVQRGQWQDAAAHYNAGDALLKHQQTKEAIEQFHAALQLRPNWPEVLNNLAWLLATHPDARLRNGPAAVSLAQRACELTSHTNLSLLATLAAAYAEAGHHAEAVHTQQKVCDLAAAHGQSAHTESLRQRLELYRSGQAYHGP